MTEALIVFFKSLVHLNLNLAVLVIFAWILLGKGRGAKTSLTVWGVLVLRCLVEPWLCPQEALAPALDFSQQGSLSLGAGLSDRGQTVQLLLSQGASPLSVGDLLLSFVGVELSVASGLAALVLLSLALLHRSVGLYLARGEKRGLVWSSTALSPHIFGWWKPSIVLPAHLRRDLPRDELRAVLAHERAHLERGDHIWFALIYLARAFCVVVWPLKIVLDGLEQAIERLCDQRAAERVGKKPLARALVRLATVHSNLAPAFSHCGVKTRIRALRQGSYPDSLWVCAMALIFLGTVIL